MFNKIALIALGVLAIACGKKSDKVFPSVQPPVTQQPIANEPYPSPVTPVDTNLLTQAVGLYQQQDNENIYLRVDNQMNVETTLQLPIRVEGSDNRLTDVSADPESDVEHKPARNARLREPRRQHVR